ETIESEPEFLNVTLTARKLAAMTRMSMEISDDAVINMADRVTRDMAWAFAKSEDELGFNGAGTSGDGGIEGIVTKLNAGVGTLLGAVPVATNTHDTFAEIDAADLMTLMGRCPAYARDGAAWFCSQAAADTVFGRLKATAGGNTISELAIAGISALGQRGIVGFYFGYPIVVAQSLPIDDSNAALNDKVMLLFGNLRQAVLL